MSTATEILRAMPGWLIALCIVCTAGCLACMLVLFGLAFGMRRKP